LSGALFFFFEAAFLVKSAEWCQRFFEILRKCLGFMVSRDSAKMSKHPLRQATPKIFARGGVAGEWSVTKE
jgi:hypothetical protein